VEFDVRRRRNFLRKLDQVKITTGKLKLCILFELGRNRQQVDGLRVGE
jgi:hypothetical protein